MDVRKAFGWGVLLLVSGCSGARGDAVDTGGLQGADETVLAPASAPSGCVAAQSQVETSAALHLRQGPSTEEAIILTLPEGAQLSVPAESCPEHGFYKVRYGGFEGWAYGAWLQTTSTLSSALSADNSRDEAIARARAGVGFSYWWGHGRFLPEGPSSSTRGSCTGSCGSCSHSGSYGGDCSGYAAKVWVVPATNTNLATDSHPYATSYFNTQYSGWHNVARGSTEKADAMVYNSGGAGHIFIYEKNDPWGSMYAYECRGCADGCVYGVRTAGSSYKVIGRDGIKAGCSVGGSILVRYNELGGAGGILGGCLTSELTTPDGVGRFNHFQNGSIYWTQATGAWDIRGLIRNKWEALGWETSVLGYPTTGETATPDGVGRYNHFKKGNVVGSIYWTQATGAWELHGVIRDKWAALDWERSPLGYPITDEMVTPDGVGRYNHFKKGNIEGSIYWTPTTGARELHGVIRDKWASTNWERGPLGYPVSDEYAVTGGRENEFQKGFITYNASTNTTTVRMK